MTAPAIAVAPTPSGGLRLFLKRATTNAHRKTEKAFERFDLSARPQLASYLAAHLASLEALIYALEASGAARNSSNSRDDNAIDGRLLRELASAARADLARAAITSTPLADVIQLEPPDLPSSEARLGALYVVAGSRMGARVIAARIRSAGGAPPAYFSSHLGDGAAARILAHIDSALCDQVDYDAAARGALSTFMLFRAAALGAAKPG